MSGLLEEEEVEEDDEALFVLGRCDRAGARSCCRARWHANRRETARLCWSRRHGAAVAVRAALLLLMSALLLVALLGERSASFLRTYSWCTFLGETVALLLLLLATLLSRPRLAAAAALAFQSALPHALTVTLAYWTLIAKPHNFALSEYRMIIVHGLNFVVLLLEFVSNRIVFIPFHVFTVVAFDVAYFLLVLLPVQLITRTVIYPGLTDFFAKPGVFVAVALGIPLCNALFFFMFLVLSFTKSKFGDPLPVKLFRRPQEIEAATTSTDIELQPV